MAGHRATEHPDEALALFGGRRVTRWRLIERCGWLRDGRRVTQTTKSIFRICCWDFMLSKIQCVHEIIVRGRMTKIPIMQYRFPCGHHLHRGSYNRGLFCVESGHAFCCIYHQILTEQTHTACDLFKMLETVNTVKSICNDHLYNKINYL